MADFKLDIDKFVEKAGGNLRRFTTEFVQDLNEEVVRATPVKTGFLRGSWWGSIGSPSPQGGAPDPAGAGSVARMNLVSAQLQGGEIYYAANGASYARYVEYGTDRMAPRAFVRGTVARAQQIADAVAARLK